MDSRRTQQSPTISNTGNVSISNDSNNSYQANQFNTTLRENELIRRYSIDNELQAIQQQNRRRQLNQLRNNLTNISSRVENPTNPMLTTAQRQNRRELQKVAQRSSFVREYLNDMNRSGVKSALVHKQMETTRNLTNFSRIVNQDLDQTSIPAMRNDSLNYQNDSENMITSNISTGFRPSKSKSRTKTRTKLQDQTMSLPSTPIIQHSSNDRNGLILEATRSFGMTSGNVSDTVRTQGFTSIQQQPTQQQTQRPQRQFLFNTGRQIKQPKRSTRRTHDQSLTFGEENADPGNKRKSKDDVRTLKSKLQDLQNQLQVQNQERIKEQRLWEKQRKQMKKEAAKEAANMEKSFMKHITKMTKRIDEAERLDKERNTRMIQRIQNIGEDEAVIRALRKSVGKEGSLSTSESEDEDGDEDDAELRRRSREHRKRKREKRRGQLESEQLNLKRQTPVKNP